MFYTRLLCLKHINLRNESAVKVMDSWFAKEQPVVAIPSSDDEQKAERNSRSNPLPMLPKKLRVTTRLFQTSMKHGKVFHSPHLSVRLSPLPQGAESRFAIAVPKAYSTKATERNKLKRAFYKIIEKSFPLKAGYVVLVFIKKSTKLEDEIELGEELELLLKKAFTSDTISL